MRLFLFALTLCILEWNTFLAAQGVTRYLDKPDEWFRTPEATSVIKSILSWQTTAGAWPKNTDTTSARPAETAAQGTFDNGATTGELRFLGRAFVATGQTTYKEGFLKGLDHILDAQYPIGGWPQFHPPGAGYHRHITFNDQTMVRLMQFLRDVATRREFGFLDATRRAASQKAFDRGVDCMLKAQVRVNGTLTAWCAQHDEKNLEPRPGRTYELVSLSGAESVGILELLRTIEPKPPEVRAAIDAGVAWLKSVQINGLRQTKVDGDKRLVADPSAPPLWARFYEIGSNRPIFAGRDGVKRYSLDEIEPERRNGYAWHGTWAQKLMNSQTNSPSRPPRSP